MSDPSSSKGKRSNEPAPKKADDAVAAGTPAHLLTVREICEQLRCSSDLVYRAISSGQLAAMRIGRGRKRGRFLVRTDALMNWLLKQELETARELKARR